MIKKCWKSGTDGYLRNTCRPHLGRPLAVSGQVSTVPSTALNTQSKPIFIPTRLNVPCRQGMNHVQGNSVEGLNLVSLPIECGYFMIACMSSSFNFYMIFSILWSFIITYWLNSERNYLNKLMIILMVCLWNLIHSNDMSSLFANHWVTVVTNFMMVLSAAIVHCKIYMVLKWLHWSWMWVSATAIDAFAERDEVFYSINTRCYASLQDERCCY